MVGDILVLVRGICSQKGRKGVTKSKKLIDESGDLW
jgi:hypothetical protein